jgi:UDP-glucose 4-epimerase
MSKGAILVTGGAGYVGSHFVARLADEGRKHVVLDDLSRGDARFVSSDALIRGDIGDATLVERIAREYAVDVAVHFAAYAYVGESVSEPEYYYANNVASTIAFLAGLRRAGVRRLVFSSSCATYGEPHDGASITESEHKPETHLIPLAIDAALGLGTLTVHGNDYPTPDGTCIRDYVHVDDLADAHIQAVERLRRGGESLRANLGIGTGASVLEVLERVRGCTGIAVRHRFGERRPGDPPVLVANATLARRELAWQPRYDNLEVIVRTAVEGYRRAATIDA